MAALKAAIITISTSVAAGEREDRSGALLAELASGDGVEVAARETVPDDREAIEAALRRYCVPPNDVALVLTTGGTGLTPDDVTPEATRAVIGREVPGIAEAMRAESRKYTPMGVLSREVAGAVGETLIVNFPGSPKAIEQLFGVIAPVLEHAVALLKRKHGSAAGH
jgi:molybdenum cofactor synthesis domain-containing protein